jgi:SAM-dependent methyltransferase
MPDLPRLNLESQRVYPEVVRKIPEGLGNAILNVLDFHRGPLAAIGREDLVDQLAANGFECHERLVREVIKILRRDGHLICSAPGENGGYYMARDMAEYLHFKEHEFEPKIADMKQTIQAMDEAAKKQFGPAYQPSLIGGL